MRSATILSTSESETNCPRSMMGFANCPSGVFFTIFSRSMSPVERCGTPYLRANSFACVPFPAPEAREKSPHDPACRQGAAPPRSALPLAPAAKPALPCESFVIAHDELCFQLLHRIHRHADDDQQRSASEIKLHAKPFEEPDREMPVEPVADAPADVSRWTPAIIHSGSKQTIAR